MLAQSFSITAQSALSTLLICDRQSRKDIRKVIAACDRAFQILTCHQAKQTYRMVWNAIVIAGMVSIALGLTVRAWADALVEDSLVDIPDVPTPVLENAPLNTDEVKPTHIDNIEQTMTDIYEQSKELYQWLPYGTPAQFEYMPTERSRKWRKGFIVKSFQAHHDEQAESVIKESGYFKYRFVEYLALQRSHFIQSVDKFINPLH